MLARGVYPLYRITGVAATGGIYAAPTNQTIMFALPFDRGRGMPRPYRAVVFYCPVGRGDPTPPCGLAVISHCPDDCTGGIYAAPTDRTVNFTLPLGRGRGLPRPYRAVVFLLPRRAG